MDPADCYTADTFTSSDCITVENWEEKEKSEKENTCNVLLLAEFVEVFIARESTAIEVLDIVSYTLRNWRILLWQNRTGVTNVLVIKIPTSCIGAQFLIQIYRKDNVQMAFRGNMCDIH